MTEHHILKYRCEIPTEGRDWHYNYLFRPCDWPEIKDYEDLSVELRKKETGEPYDEVLLEASRDRLVRTITPTSRYWDMIEEENTRIQPCKKKQGRPPYFFDA